MTLYRFLFCLCLFCCGYGSAQLTITTTPTSGTHVAYPMSPYYFTMTPSGGTTPYTYKWAKNGTASYISDATLASYTIATVRTSDAGIYYAEVTDDDSTVVTSGPINITVQTEIAVAANIPSTGGLKLSGLTGADLTPGVTYTVTVPREMIGKIKSGRVGIYFYAKLNSGFPAMLSFTWYSGSSSSSSSNIGYNRASRKLALSPYMLPIIYDYPRFFGPLPKEILSANGEITFQRTIDTGNWLTVVPIIIGN